MIPSEADSPAARSFLFLSFAKFRSALASTFLFKVPQIRNLCNFIFKLLKPRGVIKVTCEGHTLFVDGRDAVMIPHFVSGGRYEPEVTDFFRHVLRPGMTVFDIGANWGYFSLLAAALVGNQGRVFAFEPEPRNFALLQRNIRANGYTNIVAVPKAISNRQGTVTLFHDRRNLGGHSISEDCVPLKNRGGSVEVETTTLDEFVDALGEEKRVDLIKMDVQGAEGLVLERAHETLRRNKVRIVMEFWPSGLGRLGTDALQLLQELQVLGFEIRVAGQLEQEPLMGNKLLELVQSCKGPHSAAHQNLLLEKR
jgi:FkbM family methyltransferase